MNNLEHTINYLKKLKLLYVEDNKDVRINTEIILREFFDKIIVAVNGQDGFNKFKNNQIDIVITDINMPKLNGLEMADKIKKINTEIPIFVFSAYRNANYFENARKLNISGYLLKPLDIEQFKITLYQCVENLKLKEENLIYKKKLENRIKKQNKLLTIQSKRNYYDQLTNIYNRHKLYELFEQEKTTLLKSSLSVIMFDIDNFKNINHTFGHNTGDQILKELTNIVAKNIRSMDIFARWKSEKFIIILFDTNIKSASIKAESIRNNIATHKFKKVNEITISLGVSKYEKDDDLETLIKKCTTALYKAKSNGKNLVVTL